ncbi:MAG: hypothetical protein L0216_16420 [Planctomycetales bacterium]|nr:hypothetical protein [Planctomycetales bacterium]
MIEYVARSAAGSLLVAGSPVTLASLVHGFWHGETPETLVQAFPSLSLEKTYGAVAYYLANRDAVDREIRPQAPQEGRGGGGTP